MEPALIWKLALAVGLIAVISVCALARAPRRSFPPADLRAMIFSALVLYSVGLGAGLSHHVVVAAAVYSSGIAVSAFAAWLSRGSDSGGPPGGDTPSHEPPPTDPTPGFDWVAFERQLREYTRRQERQPVGSR
jgi:hypothetical protein